MVVTGELLLCCCLVDWKLLAVGNDLRQDSLACRQHKGLDAVLPLLSCLFLPSESKCTWVLVHLRFQGSILRRDLNCIIDFNLLCIMWLSLQS